MASNTSSPESEIVTGRPGSSCPSDVAAATYRERVATSPVVTALAHESTEISNHNRLVLYTQITDKEMSPSTHFVTNVELQQPTFNMASHTVVKSVSDVSVTGRQLNISVCEFDDVDPDSPKL